MRKLQLIALISILSGISSCSGSNTDGETDSAVNSTVRNATEWNAAIAAVNAAGSNKTHTIVISQSFSLPGTAATIFVRELSGLTVTVKGQGNTVPVISLANGSTGHLLCLNSFEPQRIILENIVLKGHANNTAPLVNVDIKGELIAGEGSRITGNTNTRGGGGGVHVGSAVFTLKGGEISGNTAGTPAETNGSGGGVYLSDLADFVMEDGVIGSNLAYGHGGGVYAGFMAEFTMKGGIIFGNTAMATSAGARGGGVYNSGGKVRMTGGRITGYDKSHGAVIDITEHISVDPARRDSCNAVVITATAVGNFGASLNSRYSDGNFYGVFEGDTFTQKGSLGSRRERDIEIINGVLQP
jgi:hypothetical protein